MRSVGCGPPVQAQEVETGKCSLARQAVSFWSSLASAVPHDTAVEGPVLISTVYSGERLPLTLTTTVITSGFPSV